ncbi:MAG: ABC transporter ATP-binding protein, partial [Bacteroidota bacterium]
SDANENTMLEVENLVKKFDDKTAVDGVSFSVSSGEVTALIGTSGCGKTTTLKMINRLVEPTSGTIRINGKITTGINPIELRRQIGYVIQENGLFPHYTVAENIGVVPRLLGYSAQQIQALIPEVLQKVELPIKGIQDKYPNALSGGQQQRVAIARAIAASPPLLLMDEPFSALDPITRITARKNFQQFIRKIGIAVVLVTHDVAEAIDLADTIVLMDKGKIVQMGSAADLLFQPASDYVVSFFAENKMETELKVVKIKDLFPFLNHRNLDSKEMPTLQFEDNLYDISNRYSLSLDKAFQLLEPNQPSPITVLYNDLLVAFQTYKSTYGTGR